MPQLIHHSTPLFTIKPHFFTFSAIFGMPARHMDAQTDTADIRRRRRFPGIHEEFIFLPYGDATDVGPSE